MAAMLILAGFPAWGGPLWRSAEYDKPNAFLVNGNGGLTIGVDEAGRISVCRWPGPGDANHVVLSRGGLKWGADIAGEMRWMDAPGVEVSQELARDSLAWIESSFKMASPSIDARQIAFASPERGVLAMRIVCSAAQVEQLTWAAPFAPCTRQIPEWAMLNEAFPSLNGFAAYTLDGGATVICFRPRNPGQADYSKAARLVAESPETAAKEWAGFGDGVWIACGGPNKVLKTSLGDGAGCAALRPSDIRVALLPEYADDGARATMFASFGKDCESAVSGLKDALGRGWDELKDESERYWKGQLYSGFSPIAGDAALRDICVRDLLVLLQCVDRRTGAVVRSPVGDAWDSLAWTRDAPWISLAFDFAGRREFAERNAMFFVDAVREKGERGKPFGSAPAALCSNGVEGAPGVVLDVDASAWLIAMCRRHAGFLEQAERTRFLSEVSKRLLGTGDFLVGWMDDRARQPLYSFDYGTSRDVFSRERLLTTYMGIDASLRIVTGAGAAAPEIWRGRKRDLEASILFQCVGKSGEWTSQFSVPYWQPEMNETELPSWDDAVKRQLSDPKRNEDVSTLCDAALLWRDQPELLQVLKPRFGAFLKPSPDSVSAAKHFIAASIVYAAPKVSSE
jgi:hypothetical protein